MNQKGLSPMTKQRCIRFEDEMYEWLEALAKKDKRSVSDIIRMILEEAKNMGWEP